MRGPAKASLVAFVTCAAINVACSEPRTSPPGADATESRTPADRLLVPAERLGGIEAHFAKIAESVPEFAGYYYEHGDLVVKLTDTSKGPEVRDFTDAVAARGRPPGDARQTVFRQAQHTFSDLRLYRDIVAANAHERGGVRYIDLDEVSNRVIVAVRSLGSRLDLEARGRVAGIPDDAIQYVVVSGELAPDVGTALTHTDLKSRVDTVLGGVRGRHDSNLACTIWVGAAQGTNKVHLTASHCDDDGFAENKNGTLYQPIFTANDAIGDEAKDPTSTCTVPLWADHNPGSTDCRWADAALYDASNLNRFQKGWVAWVNNQSGGLDIVHDSMNTISGEVGWPAVNDTVQMVGQTSGWRIGPVKRTCVMVFLWPSAVEDYTLRCQEFALYTAAGGDSGAPIFIDDGGLKKMIGMHVGRTPTPGDTSIFSSMNNIEVDLGLLDVIGPPVLESRAPSTRVRIGSEE